MRLDHLLSKEKSRGCGYCLLFDLKGFLLAKIPGLDFCEKGDAAKRSESRGTEGRTKAEHAATLLVPIHPGDTPVPIPNTTVKTRTAEGTMLETAWENRWVPEFMTGFYRSPEGSGD